ncbi:M23 family metallopeptidase [Geomonas sp.]|uniref:M23 family metallopeptidase n=1 Tax=Geomonas sp. TaxID=2651584 RepID=UPI002B467517|nr:M23 family metallopeptidase [Geomonas sp.]HJV36846.1 M23 family metallopeptidase [Geomonas sp.]
MKSSSIFGVLIVAALAAIGFFYLRDMRGPEVSLSPGPGPVSGKAEMAVSLHDPGSGMKKLSIIALQGQRTITVLSREYPPKTYTARESFRLAETPSLKDGPFKLEVSSNDRALYHLGAGNRTVKAIDYTYQNKPPAVTALSIAHNIARGGVGLVIYTVNREVQKTGVVFADRFFPGYHQFGDVYACLFPFPYNLPTERFVPKILAVDRAGNERVTGIYFHLIPKAFPSDRIQLPDTYLDKVSAEFKDRFPQANTPLEIFLKANRDLRVHDLKQLEEVGKKTSPTFLWEGPFLRMPNSAPRGGYAQFRDYYYHGKLVDQETHLGIDLAALAHAKVPAANRGKIVYADDLGIYGQCVIIDHGLGLQTLYGHLSGIGVKVGEDVQKGQIIGTTGDTGLAGGDHLHFGVMVSGEQVNPIEWWDPSWINNNITSKLQDAKETAKAR